MEKPANENIAISIQKETNVQYKPLAFLTIEPLAGNWNRSFSCNLERYTKVKTPKATKIKE